MNKNKDGLHIEQNEFGKWNFYFMENGRQIFSTGARGAQDYENRKDAFEILCDTLDNLRACPVFTHPLYEREQVISVAILFDKQKRGEL